MKVELHLHTSRYSGCAANSPAESMQRLIELGYGAVYITEHDRVWTPFELDDLREQFPNIKIFGGVELTVGFARMQHLLVLGTSDPGYIDLAGEEEAILKKARHDGHLTVLAHPFRWKEDETMMDRGNNPDAIEYLTCNHDAPEMKAQSKAAATRFHVRLVNSGDVHRLDFMGRFWIETLQPLAEAEDIRRIVLRREYRNRRNSG
ncbi:MAG: PHP domain-containing protein [Planctomycetaceae bacterium]|nr:PHP domain-containing protein [Planctomycetaceae bacterium]